MSAVVVRDVVRRFGAVTALDGVSLSAEAGRITGLVGPDGAGKTTLIRIIAGLLDADAGTVDVLGGRPDDDAVREDVGLMPQRHSLYGDLSVSENLQFFRQLFCLDRREGDARIGRLLELTRLAPFTDRRADALSGGMYKKLALAVALLHQPKVLLLDEPTNGVDPVSRRELWTLLGEFVADGMAVVVSTPTMDEAERCHHVHLLHEGRVLAAGAPARLARDLPHPVVVVDGPNRDAIRATLASSPAVLAYSPAGERVRVVVHAGELDAVRAALPHASITAVRPDFEDLFLAAVHTAGEAA